MVIGIGTQAIYGMFNESDGFYREYDGFNHLTRIRQGNTSSGNITEEFTWHPTEERILIKDVYSNGVYV